MSKVSLVAIDLDGTLIGKEGLISQRNVRAMQAAVDQGCTVVLNSGRNYESIRYVAQRNGLSLPILSCNGAQANTAQGECLFSRYLQREIVEDVLEKIVDHQLPYVLFAQGAVCDGAEHPEPWGIQRVNGEDGTIGPEHMAYFCLPKEEIMERFGDTTYKLVVLGEETPLKALRQALAQKDTTEVSASWANNIEICAKDVNKGTGILWLAERLGIPQEETMAIGDQENDLSMFGAVRYSVAMGNAPDWIKKKTTYQAPAYLEDGVADTFERYVLI